MKGRRNKSDKFEPLDSNQSPKRPHWQGLGLELRIKYTYVKTNV